jgi:hypothetical protein
MPANTMKIYEVSKGDEDCRVFSATLQEALKYLNRQTFDAILLEPEPMATTNTETEFDATGDESGIYHSDGAAGIRNRKSKFGHSPSDSTADSTGGSDLRVYYDLN